ncbi:helix-turn-helix domain-containing protein [Marinomonas posidonica]|uniref:Transcriptional regulator, AraC family n=1 Tax=Marinomonas posidonica (strain CECT 7376 / NCIMB 14433 / IVIA-Po-181) TaxID=491952 RepID=F6CVH3_MARPP|nr:helix-turn-helix domain-containing protein [Marinomonas posidonica]AEF55350.1 transcriptional regulator, AraC family [Marinomonas posidonica IVIA-Po-181]
MLTNIIGSMVRFEAIQPGLQPRTFSTGSGNFTNFNLIGVVQRGDVSVLYEDEQHNVIGSSIFCLPHKASAKILVPAGSQIWLIGYSNELTSLVMGTELDSTKLEILMHQLTLTQCQTSDINDTFLPLLKLLNLEISFTKNRSQTIICAIIRILLINTYRLTNIQSIKLNNSPDELVLQRFRQLVEIEFKNRQPVSYYCNELNVTYDRLHAICQRNLQKPPLQLINNRVLIEATNRLKKPSDSIQMIASQLGYSDASQFSHFFKKETRLSPNQFRKNNTTKGTLKGSNYEYNFFDWP